MTANTVPVSALGGMILPFGVGRGKAFGKLAALKLSHDLLSSLSSVDDSILGEDMP